MFRMGDFFEMFHEDAVTAAPILNITLTMRNRKCSDETKMCGVPYHSIAGPISKLLASGLKVAICDQMEPATKGKTLVKREVTRVLTPGMVYDPESLDRLSTYYLCAFDLNSISFVDASTGEAFYYSTEESQLRLDLLNLLNPVELVLTPLQHKKYFSSKHLARFHISVFDKQESLSPGPLRRSDFSPPVSKALGEQALKNPLGRGLASSSPEDKDSSRYKHSGESTGLEHPQSAKQDIPDSAERLLCYVSSEQGAMGLKAIRPFEQRFVHSELRITNSSVKHLEFFQILSGHKEGSLFHSINRTVTSFGSRLLKTRLRHPLSRLADIEKRQSRLEEWYKNPDKIKAFRQALGPVGDVERKMVKIAHPACTGRDLLDLSHSLDCVLSALKIVAPYLFKGTFSEEKEWDTKEQDTKEQILSLEESAREVLFKVPEGVLQALSCLVKDIKDTINPEASLGLRSQNFYSKTGIIKKGVCSKLDQLLNAKARGFSRIEELEKSEQISTRIPSLKIRHNHIFGFYIEVTKVHTSKVPSHYVRKQTLTQSERYTLPLLQEIEDELFKLQQVVSEAEERLFQNLKQEILNHFPEVSALVSQTARADVESSLAWLALERSYVRPRFLNLQGHAIYLKNSRHPVLEQKHHFIPNTISLGEQDSVEQRKGECLLLTGPNMAGKSTLMRQVALSVVMAQMGCFVAAEEADLPVFTHLFTRIGANDNLSQGLSTFMVEMKEMAEIIQFSNPRIVNYFG